MKKGVEVEDLRVGDGPEATQESTVRIRYTGSLRRGDLFQSEFEYEMHLGDRQVIAGLRYGLLGMREGGRRKIRVSPHLAYGERGVPGVIPPNALLIFDVELLELKQTVRCESIEDQ